MTFSRPEHDLEGVHDVPIVEQLQKAHFLLGNLQVFLVAPQSDDHAEGADGEKDH